MPIDYTRLRGLTARRLATALQRDGFALTRRKGATRFFKHPDGRRATIHLHRPDQILPNRVDEAAKRAGVHVVRNPHMYIR
jgi:predicted RNA binding protein YcfA (HicA-like mRNA interferase family)